MLVYMLRHHGSVADMLDQGLIGFHAPEPSDSERRLSVPGSEQVCVYACGYVDRV